MKTRSSPFRPSRAQRGSVLLITVILLLLLTVLALGAVYLNTTQTRIATNSADAQIAFQTAEGALNQAQINILAGNYTASSFATNSNGLYTFDPTSPPKWTNWTSADWHNASLAIQSTFHGNSSAVATYIIERLPSFIVAGQSMNQNTLALRVTVRAVGASGAVPVMLQSTIQIQQ